MPREILVRVEIVLVTGEKALTCRARPVAINGMEPTAMLSAVGDALRVEPVGKIEPATPTINAQVEAFLAYLHGRRKAASTITRWRHMLTTNARDAGWPCVESVTCSGITDWLTAEATARNWKGTTVNAHLAAWRSFCRWAVRRGMIERNPLADAESAVEAEHGEGARAPTTDEARALLSVSRAFESADGRSKPRLAYFACLFLAGCRFTEPGRWLWSDLHLDAEIPHVVWRGEIQKNRRRATIALCPELAAVLRALPRTGPSVFRVKPNGGTFRADRERAGVVKADTQGRTFSPHGARKWFSTTLTNAGIPPRMVDFLMRHTGSVEARYYQPTLKEQAEALLSVPILLAQTLRAQEFGKKSQENDQNHLAWRVGIAESLGAETIENVMTYTQDITSPCLPAVMAGRLSNAPNTLAGGGSSCFAQQPLGCSGSDSGDRIGNRGYTLGNRDASLVEVIASLARVLERLLAKETPVMTRESAERSNANGGAA